MNAISNAVVLAAVGEKPAVAPTGIEVQLGAGAIAIGLLIWAIAMIKAGRWAKGPVLVGFAVGTVTAGASGLLGMPGDLTNQLVSALGSSLGAM